VGLCLQCTGHHGPPVQSRRTDPALYQALISKFIETMTIIRKVY